MESTATNDDEHDPFRESLALFGVLWDRAERWEEMNARSPIPMDGVASNGALVLGGGDESVVATDIHSWLNLYYCR